LGAFGAAYFNDLRVASVESSMSVAESGVVLRCACGVSAIVESYGSWAVSRIARLQWMAGRDLPCRGQNWVELGVELAAYNGPAEVVLSASAEGIDGSSCSKCDGRGHQRLERPGSPATEHYAEDRFYAALRRRITTTQMALNPFNM